MGASPRVAATWRGVSPSAMPSPRMRQPSAASTLQMTAQPRGGRGVWSQPAAALGLWRRWRGLLGRRGLLRAWEGGPAVLTRRVAVV